MARNQPLPPPMREVRGDFEKSLEHYMVKAAFLAAEVDAALTLDQIKTPAVAEKIKTALANFYAA